MDVDLTLAEAYAQPAPVAADVEAIMARNIVRRALVVGPLIVAVAWFARGSLGGISAAVGVGIVLANFLLSGWALSKAAKLSLNIYRAVAMFGFIVRFGLLAVSMFVVAWLFNVDRLALGLAAIAAFLALLVLESVAMLRGGRKELEWV